MSERHADMHDEELLDRFQAGDAEAFAALLTRYRTALFNFVLRTVKQPDVAADILQDTWTRVIQRSEDWNRSAKFSTWLYTIARNLCIDHLRKQRHRRHASLDASGNHDGHAGAPLAERVAGEGPDAERQAAAHGMRGRIATAVEALPQEQREVFLLRQLQQMPFAQIAQLTGVSENTVKSRMRYALERLQQALADYADEAEARG